MPKKRIIHIIQSLDNGGCENMLLRTLPLLSSFEHTIITLKKEGELAPRFKEKNIQVINLNQKSLLDVSSYSKLLKLTNEIQPDTILTYLFHADVIGRLFIQPFFRHSRRGGNPVRIIPFLRTTYNHKKYWLPRLFEKLTYKQVPHYLANSESVKNFLTKTGVDENKVIVIPNGIDTDFYDQIPRDEKLRRNLGINPDETVIICVANLHINKGHKYLLEAFEQLHTSPPSQGGEFQPNADQPLAEKRGLKLIIVGDGEEKENLLKQVEEYSSKNNIYFLGKRNDVPQLLKISDIFVLPTLFEGMSNAIMEAMTSGLAVITTDIPENRQLINHEENGFLSEQQNTNDLKNKINSLITNKALKNRLKNNSQNVIKDNYSMSIITSKWTIFLDEKD